MSVIDEAFSRKIIGARRYPGAPEPGPGTTAPAKPTDVVATGGDGSAMVSFSALDSGGSPIIQYKVVSSPGGIEGLGTKSPVMVSGLTNGVDYTFVAYATNAIGTSVASDPSNTITPEQADEAPGAPTMGVVTAGDSSAVVNFTAPADDGGSEIIQYIVTSSPEGITAVGTASPITVTGLANGTPYSFTVRAQNAIGLGGNSGASTPVTPTGIPGQPSITSVVAGAAQLTVAFTAPEDIGGSAITGYRVEVDPSDYFAEGSGSPLVVTGLTNGVEYTAKVRAINAAGNGLWSAFSAPVAPRTVPSAPVAPTAVPGNQSAQVSFVAPYNGGSTITGYTVTASPGGATAQGQVSPITVPGLTNGTPYTFTVAAANAAGTGPASPASNSVTPAQVPGQPTGVTAVAGPGANEATVSFTAPASNGGNAIIDYTVTGSDGDTATGASSPIVVTGLDLGTHSFTVTARNTIGSSPASTASQPISIYEAPGAPTSVSATVSGDRAMSVSFTAPASNGGNAITEYTVTSDPDGLTATGAASPIVIDGLTRDTAYTYTVVATNAAGDGPASTASSAVTALGTPDAPTDVVSTAGDTEASVAFVAPANNGGAAITGYTVISSPGSFEASGAASPIVVPGLINGVGYSFTVVASNTYGDGASSEPSSPVTPFGIPTVPEITELERGASGEILVYFTESDSNGSPITEYTVTSSPGSVVGTGVSSPVTVSGLTNGTPYRFSMTATNAAGTSAASVQSASITPATVPGAPTIGTATASDASASVAFTAPASNGGLAITGYRVTATPGGATATGTASPINIVGLANGTAHTFTVAAENEIGYGAESAASNSVTPTQSSTVPGAPSITSATVGSGQVTIAFLPPGNTGGSPIIDYTVTSTGGQTATGTASPITVTGLTNGTPYRFHVTARNSSGSGPASTQTSFLTPVGVPGAPTNVVATGADASAVVSFTPPASNGGSTILDYTITSSPGGITKTGTGSPMTITGLSNGTPYTFTVKARNAVGSSAASAASNSVTPASAAEPGPFDSLYAASWSPVIGLSSGTVSSTNNQAAGTLTTEYAQGAMTHPVKLDSTPTYRTDATFGTKIVRLTDVSDVPTAASTTRLRHEYSKRTPWSRDGLYYFMWNGGSYLWAYDAATGQRIDGGKTYPDSAVGAIGRPGGSGTTAASQHPRDPCDWMPSPIEGEDHIIWFKPRGKGWTMYRYDFVNHTISTLFNIESMVKALSSRFSTSDGYTMGGEGRCSDDGRYWGFKVGIMDSAGRSNLDTPHGLVTYDRVLNRIDGWIATDTNPNNIAMSSRGTYILASDVDSGTYAECQASSNLNYRGSQRWTRDFSSRLTMHVSSQHADPGIDAAGNEVYVTSHYEGSTRALYHPSGTGGSIPDGVVYYRRMDNGQAYPLFNVYYRPNSADPAISGGHYSCVMSAERPGWMLTSTYHDSRRGSYAWKDNVIFYIKLEPGGNPEVRFVCHHHGVRSNPDLGGVGYWQEPHATADRTGLRVVWAASWDNSDGDPYGVLTDSTVYSYAAFLPSWFFGDTSAAPPDDPDNELTNGTLDSDSGWTVTNGGWTFANGKATYANAGGGASSITQPYAFIAGNQYRVTVDLLDYTGPGDCAIRFEGSGTTAAADTNFYGNGTHSTEMTANSGNTTFVLRAFGTFAGSVDNIRLEDLGAPPPANRIDNGTFDSAGAGWTIYSGTPSMATGALVVTSASTSQVVGRELNGTAPGEGAVITLQFDLLSYVNGNIGPRIRYTDGTFTYFFGDQLGNGPLAGGDATAAVGTTVTAPTITVPAGKTVSRLELRSTARSSANDHSMDNIVVTVT